MARARDFSQSEISRPRVYVIIVVIVIIVFVAVLAIIVAYTYRSVHRLGVRISPRANSR